MFRQKILNWVEWIDKTDSIGKKKELDILHVLWSLKRIKSRMKKSFPHFIHDNNWPSPPRPACLSSNGHYTTLFSPDHPRVPSYKTRLSWEIWYEAHEICMQFMPLPAHQKCICWESSDFINIISGLQMSLIFQKKMGAFPVSSRLLLTWFRIFFQNVSTHSHKRKLSWCRKSRST